jgi:hypothetical protein
MTTDQIIKARLASATDLRAHVFNTTVANRRMGFRYELTLTDGPGMTAPERIESYVLKTLRGCRALAKQFGATPHNF